MHGRSLCMDLRRVRNKCTSITLDDKLLFNQEVKERKNWIWMVFVAYVWICDSIWLSYVTTCPLMLNVVGFKDVAWFWRQPLEYSFVLPTGLSITNQIIWTAQPVLFIPFFPHKSTLCYVQILLQLYPSQISMYTIQKGRTYNTLNYVIFLWQKSR